MKYNKGFNVKEAFDATTGFRATTLKNLTQSFKLSKKDNAADFAADYLENKADVGVVYYIVIEKPINDTRNKPYSVEHVKVTKKRKYAMSYSIIDSDKKEYACKEHKSDALVVAKELVKEHKRDMFLKIVKTVIEGEPFSAEVNYTPSKNTREGSFLFFELLEERPNKVTGKVVDAEVSMDSVSEVV